MRFHSEHCADFVFGDHRVIQRYAWFPLRVQKPDGSFCRIWLEYYDVVQKYYTNVPGHWSFQHRAVPGYGAVLATEGAKLWGGRVV